MKYYFFLGFFGATTGYYLPLLKLLQIMVDALLGSQFFFILIIASSVLLLLALIGFIFDRFGRVASFIIIIIFLAFGAYFDVYGVLFLEITLSIGMAAYIGGIISIPLIIGDTSTKEKMGNRLTLSFLILGCGLVLGFFLRDSVTPLFIEASLIDELANRTILLASIGCLVFLYILFGIKERVTWKEHDWRQFIIQLYILHKSGMLLYENTYFKKQDDENISPLLISGGFIGLITMLQHIVKAKTSVRTIDHGDRKLMFKFNGTEKIIFILLVREDLFIFRKKIEDLIEDFDIKYSESEADQLLDKGLYPEKFKDLKDIVKLHFG